MHSWFIHMSHRHTPSTHIVLWNIMQALSNVLHLHARDLTFQSLMGWFTANNISLRNNMLCYIWQPKIYAYHISKSESNEIKSKQIQFLNKSAKWHCGRHTLICKKILIKKTWLTMVYEWFLSVVSEKKI